MAESSKYIIRLVMPDELSLSRFRELETLLIVRGWDVSAWFDSVVQIALSEDRTELESRGNLVDGASIRGAISREYGKDVSLNFLKELRQDVWSDGEDYYSAPNGKTRTFRYDLEKCLLKFGEMLESGKVTKSREYFQKLSKKER